MKTPCWLKHTLKPKPPPATTRHKHILKAMPPPTTTKKKHILKSIPPATAPFHLKIKKKKKKNSEMIEKQKKLIAIAYF